MQTGIVDIFFKDPNKLFGFIKDGSKDVFFHLHRGGQFICDGSEDPVYVKATDDLPLPKAGDEIVYELGESPKGPRAVTWAFLSSFVEADKQIANRPYFRLLHRSGFVGEDAKYTVIWEGKDLSDLREKCPASNPVYAIHNEIQSSLTIQAFTNNEWVCCKDPR